MDLLTINYQTLNTYTILAIQDFKKLYDAEIASLKAEIQNLKSLISGSNP